MKIALYARVSTTEQNTDTQTAALSEYCGRRGWTVAGEYVDAGQGGATVQRPELDRLMRDAVARKFDAVLVWKFDRLFRSVAHMLEALERFRSLGVDFVSLTESIDTTSPIGKMVFTLLAAVAEFERDLIRERTKAGMARARAEGKRIGRPRVLVDIAEAQALWKGGEGLSYRKIAKRMQCSATKIFRALNFRELHI
jgi:DNA invertase Pin-like site-specific DNA recombinase